MKDCMEMLPRQATAISLAFERWKRKYTNGDARHLLKRVPWATEVKRGPKNKRHRP